MNAVTFAGTLVLDIFEDVNAFDLFNEVSAVIANQRV